MNLIIDVGNTRVKAAVFKDNKLQESFSLDHSQIIPHIKKIEEVYQIDKVIVSKVTSIMDEDIKKLLEEKKVLMLTHQTEVPFNNEYGTPNTLGIDRIALAAAAFEQFPKKSTLVIDAGTCITYDFITSDGHYIGGAISPGIEMRYKALHHYTGGLPKLQTVLPKSLIGNNTDTSIHSGVINGVLLEIEGIISEYRKKYSDLTVVLTGGDTNFLAKQLKSSIFANQNFLLEGLNSILIFNSSK